MSWQGSYTGTEFSGGRGKPDGGKPDFVKTGFEDMRIDRHPASYYAATAVGDRTHTPLDTSTDADVCVVGAGFPGLSAALCLAEQGLRVVLLEAERVGFGASGRCGGLIGTGQRRDVLELEARFGRDLSRQLFTLAEAAKAEVRRRVAAHDIDCDLVSGQLVGIHKPAYRGYPAELAHTLAEHYDYPHALALDRRETRERVATDDFLESFWDADGAALHPLNYLLGLARAASAAGVRIHENSRVVAVGRGDPAVVRTATGEVEAAFVVLACNAYLGRLEPRIAGRIMPINNFMIATEPLGEARARELLAGPFGVHDSRFVVNYFRLTADHRLLFGGGENYRRRFPADIAGFVRPYLLKLFPQLEDVDIDYAWGGTLAITVNRLPDIGRLPPNVWYAQGYSGHGIATATFAGRLIAEAIDGQADRFDVLANLPSRSFPGGRFLRYPGMVLAMLYYALRDRL